MTIADYFAIGVLIVSIGWAARRFLMTYHLSLRQCEPEKPAMPAEGSRLTAAFIATKLRDAGLGCEIVNLVPTETAVLRRDCIVSSLRSPY